MSEAEADLGKCQVFGGSGECGMRRGCWCVAHLLRAQEFNHRYTIGGMTKKEAEKLAKQMVELGCQCLPEIQQIIRNGKFHK